MLKFLLKLFNYFPLLNMTAFTCRLFALLIIIICTIPYTLTRLSSLPSYTPRLLNAISESAPNKNVVFSPFSIRAALTLLHLGLEGPAAKEIETEFNLSKVKLNNARKHRAIIRNARKNKNITIKMANRLYAAKNFPILESYQMITKEYFSSETQNVNFADSATVKQINDWIANRTAQKIPKLYSVGDFDALTKFVLVNAIYFKGNWLQPFDEKQTEKNNFFISKTKMVKVDMMHRMGKYKIRYSKKLNAQIISLPFAAKHYQMLILLPNLQDSDGIEALQNLVKNLENVSFLKMAKRLTIKNVNVALPKFKVNFKLELVDILKKIGLKHIFEEGAANYSSLTPSQEALFVSKVTHEAFIEVNEEGAEAGGATGVSIINRSFDLFIADHPFLYAILSTNAVLFVGYILDF